MLSRRATASAAAEFKSHHRMSEGLNLLLLRCEFGTLHQLQERTNRVFALVTAYKRLNSFTEISGSGTGLHIFLKTQQPPTSGCRRGSFEVYWTRRWVAITGDHLAGTPTDLEDRTDLLLEIHREVFGPPPDTTLPPVAPPTAPLLLSDDEVLALARTAANGLRFRELFDGPVPAGDHSRIDFALVCKLLFWLAGDLDRVDRVFRKSALMRPKWLRADYRLSTLRNAARRVIEYYSPSKD